jgi:predicted SprT family Zn-dependent metalloprotease
MFLEEAGKMIRIVIAHCLCHILYLAFGKVTDMGKVDLAGGRVFLRMMKAYRLR